MPLCVCPLASPKTVLPQLMLFASWRSLLLQPGGMPYAHLVYSVPFMGSMVIEAVASIRQHFDRCCNLRHQQATHSAFRACSAVLEAFCAALSLVEIT